MTTKTRSPIEERLVAGMLVRMMLPSVGVFDCVHRPHIARRIIASIWDSSPVDTLEHQCREFNSSLIRSGTRSQ